MFDVTARVCVCLYVCVTAYVCVCLLLTNQCFQVFLCFPPDKVYFFLSNETRGCVMYVPVAAPCSAGVHVIPVPQGDVCL